MIVGDNYIFYHVPKNAGTSIKKVLKDVYGGKQRGVHTSVKKSLKLLGHVVINNSYRFAVVRNPYARVVSWYLHLKREAEEGLKKENIIKPLSFELFVKFQRQIYKHKPMNEIGLFQTQCDYLDIGNLGVDSIIKYENLQNDFDSVCKKLFGDFHKLEHLKAWDDSDWRKYYNDELSDYVYEKFKEDFEEFGYDKYKTV